MHFTSKFIFLAIALAYGGTAVSAVSVRGSSVAARSVDEVMDLFVRNPFPNPPQAQMAPSRTSTASASQPIAMPSAKVTHVTGSNLNQN